MIKVDATSLEKRLNLSVIARTFVNGVSACVVFKSLTSNNELRIRYNFERVWTRLKKKRVDKNLIVLKLKECLPSQ